MSKSIVPQSGDGIVPNTTPEDFELDEIQWERNDYPVHSDSIPFKRTTNKILEELEQ